MTRLRNLSLITFTPALVLLQLSGCASKSYSSAEMTRQHVESQAARVPLVNYTSTTPLLECVGDHMREGRAAPLLIGWSVADTSAKTGVDQGLLIRAALHKVARRGAGIRMTSMGAPPGSPEARGSLHLSPEERLRASRGGQDRYQLAVPDWVVEGGVSSAPSGVQYRQQSAGGAGRDADLGFSGSKSFDAAFASYTLKRFADGVDITGATVDLRVVYQQGSTSADLGVYLAYTTGGKRRGAGLRFGDTQGYAESPETALRVAVETAIAMLLAEQHGIDLSQCPAQSPPLDSKVLQQTAPLAPNQVASFFDGLNATERVRWLQQALAAQGYEPGPADGVPGPGTRRAIAAFERDHRMPPGGGRVELPLLAAVAQTRIANGEDIRQPPGNGRAAGLKIVLNVPYGQYLAGQKLRAQVIVPQAGHLACLMSSPDDGVFALFPLLAGRSGFAAARAPVHLPAATDGPGHPALTLAAGTHTLYCLHSRTPVAVPPALRINADRKGHPTLKDAAEALRRAAGTQLIAEATSTFDVQPAR